MHPVEDACWSFQTAQFFVGFYADTELTDPADLFDCQEDVDAIHNGSVEWFGASVRVFFKDDVDNPFAWQEIGSDHLGGCAYKTVREFYTSHRDPDPMNRNSSLMRAASGQNVVICHYFPDMVRLAIQDARRNLVKLRRLALRA